MVLEFAQMDPNEIIKHVPGVMKAGGAIAGGWKLSDVAKAFLGPAVGEFAERWRDEVRLYRFGRQLECLKKAEQMAKDAGLTPKAVPIKILFPLLEGASLEENEELHTMWAALLANAAKPGDAAKVRPMFLEILRRMAPDEAMLLKLISESAADQLTMVQWAMNEIGTEKDDLLCWSDGTQVTFPPSFGPKYRTEEGWADCISVLESSSLVTHFNGVPMVARFGRAFLEACTPPAQLKKD
jgi:hypothetical protein